jgi:GT2 family glycosyltransferase
MQDRNHFISILLPLPTSQWSDIQMQVRFVRTIESLLAQGINRWELVIGVLAQHKPKVTSWLKALILEKSANKSQLRLVVCSLNDLNSLSTKQTTVQTDQGLNLKNLVRAAKGDWVGFAFAGDQFASHFVFECLIHIAKKPMVKMVYFDDDLLKGRAVLSRVNPQFKPDFSPDFLLGYNYIGLSFLAKRRKLVEVTNIKWQQSLNFPMQLVLDLSRRLMANEKKYNSKHLVSESVLPAWHDKHPIQRVGSVLRHRDIANGQHSRHETSNLALLDAKRLVSKHISQFTESPDSICLNQVQVSNELNKNLKISWPMPKVEPKVSIIVPTKDQYAILKVCLESLLSKTKYHNFEVVVVDNQTTQASALRYLLSLHKREPRVRVLKYDKPFNYSDINNYAVAQTNGEVLLFLNNDVEVLDGQWLNEMVSQTIRPDVGCVGAKLLYPDLTIQHGGVSLGMHGVADHMYRGLTENAETDTYGNLSHIRNTGAVTGAVMSIRRSVFDQIGRFNAKKLPVAFNDVDLCLKAEMAGYRTVWTPYACLIHHESKTRAPRKVSQKQQSSVKVRSHSTEQSEIAYMKMKWSRLLKSKFRVLANRVEPLRFL